MDTAHKKRAVEVDIGSAPDRGCAEADGDETGVLSTLITSSASLGQGA